MKRIFSSAVIILLMTAAAQAQTDTTKNATHQQHQRMQDRDGGYKQLNLSAEQQAKLKTMREDFKKQADALKEQKLTEAERRTALQSLREQQQTQLQSILTPTQKEAWEKMKANRKEGMRDGKRQKGDSTLQGDGRSSKGGANLQKQLTLTSEQQAKMKEIRMDFKAKAETLRNDQALTKEQKQTKLNALRKQQQEQVKTVLTKEQQEKLQSLRSQRKAPVTR